MVVAFDMGVNVTAEPPAAYYLVRDTFDPSARNVLRL
jgi:hypothetical protein